MDTHNKQETSRNNLSQPSLSYAMDLMKNKLESTRIIYKSTEKLEDWIIHSVQSSSPKRAKTSPTLNLEECIKSNKIINVVCDENTKILSCVKVYQMLKKCFSNRYYIILDDSSFDSVYSKVLEAFKDNCCLLAICSFRPIPDELIQIVSDTENKQIIWIGSALSGIRSISLDIGFSHLIDDVKNHIRINLQGKLVPLVDLVDGSNCDEIFTDDLVSGEVIGRPLDGLGEVASYHIPRTLKREGEQCRSDQIRPDDDNKFVLILACPGMGKSTLLSSMMGERFHWKYRINLREHSKIILNQEKMEALLFLKKANVMSEYEYKLFRVAYEHRGGIVLFFDGFDEIMPNCKDNVLQLFQSLRSSKVDEVWITTRPGFEQELEEKLETKALHLQPFSRDDQKEFLKKIWKDSDDHEVDDMLEKISIATNNDSGFAEIPLHLKMISEMRNEIIGSEINIFSLYEKFFHIKFDDVAKKGKLTTVWGNYEKMALLALFNKHDLLQVISIEEIKEIMAMMVTVDDVPAFAHRTYAEFFAASWMKEFFLENRQKDFRKLRIFLHVYRYDVVGTFFDFFLCGDSEACRAVLCEDYAKLEEISQDDLLKKDLAGRTAYHMSWAYRNERMKRYLQKKKADVDSKDELFKVTPSQYEMNIIFSTFSNMFTYMDGKAYLKYVFNERSEEKKILHWACANGELSLLESSIKNGEDVNTRDEDSITPLHLAAAFGHTEVMKVLIENDALLNETDNHFTPLHLALSNEKLEAAELLIRAKADLNLTDDNRITPLHWAAMMGHDHLVQIMIDHGADVNVQNDEQNTALYYAAREGHLEVVHMLLSHGANPTLVAYFEGGPLLAAATNGHSDVARALLRHGADPNETNFDGETAMYLAASHNHRDVVQILIGSKADTELREKNNFTPLLIAAMEGHHQIVEILLNHGADPNVKDIFNNTPLYYSIDSDHQEMVQILLDKGADPNLETSDENWPAIYHAAHLGHVEIVKILLDKGADINETIEKDRTLLHFAATYDRSELARSLIDWGANLDAADENGWTPLCCAADSGHCEVVKILLENGANPALMTEAGLTALQLAREQGHEDVVEILTGDREVE